MKHVGCGGTVVDHAKKTYAYVLDDGAVVEAPAIVCIGCGMELSGDAASELEEE